jgi:hypothetical protein
MIILSNFDNKDLKDINQAKKVSEVEINLLAQILFLGITSNFDYKRKSEEITKVEDLKA